MTKNILKRKNTFNYTFNFYSMEMGDYTIFYDSGLQGIYRNLRGNCHPCNWDNSGEFKGQYMITIIYNP